MTAEEFSRRWEERKKALNDYLSRVVVTKVGVKALNWYKEQYQRAGWYNGEQWEDWKPTLRQMRGETTADKYAPLMSRRDHLFRSISKRSTSTGVVIYTQVPYSKIHNEGGTVEMSVTPKMKKWAWANFYKEIGAKQGVKKKIAWRTDASGRRSTGNAYADMLMGIALKKTGARMTIRIPKRPFLYANPVLVRVLREMIKADIKEILLGG